MDTQLLQQFLQQVHPLQADEMEAFISHWQPIEAKRKTILTAAGEKERYLYFVLEGIQRVFYLGDNNKEATIIFSYPPSFSGVADSFITQTPSAYFMEALTASHFLRIDHNQLQQLMQQYNGIQQLIFKAMAWAFKGALHRHIELQCFSNEEKFRALLQRSPHILQLVPHKYLASYLGIDASNFSKLINTVKIG